MKDRKKFRYGISVLFVFILALLPLSSAFAYNGGLLDGKTLIHGISIHSIDGSTTAVTDNNNSTNFQLNKNGDFNDTLGFVFDEPANINSFYIKVYSGNLTGLSLNFLDSENLSLGSYDFEITDGNAVISIPVVENVSKVYVHNKSAYPVSLSEFDVFGEGGETAPPVVADFTGGLLDGKLFNLGVSINNIAFNNVTNVTDNDLGTSTTLSALNVGNDILHYSFSSPVTIDAYQAKFSGFAYVRFYNSDNIKITELNTSNLVYDGTKKNLVAPVENVSKVSIENWNADSVSISEFNVFGDGIPEPPLEEIQELEAEAEHDRINLSWRIPENETFHHVNIYRKKVEDQSFFEEMFSVRTVSAAETSDGYTPMFETNGDYWNDLTVEPETTYEYKLTSESTDGIETEGVTVKATTLAEPLPVIENEKIEEDEQKNYVVSWTSPRTGTIKVLIDGEEYKTVPASDGSLTIPKEDMKYTLLGEPKIKLIPVSESGLEGNPTKPGGLEELKPAKLNFGANDLIIILMQLIGWIAPILLISLAIWYQKPLIRLIRKVATYIKERKLRA